MTADFPEHWPPQPGDLWTDKDSDAWFCQAIGEDLHMIHQGAGHFLPALGVPAELGSIVLPNPWLAQVLTRLEWRKPAGRRPCPDGGICHHSCEDSCYRVACCSPLSGVYPEDKWPADVIAREAAG